MCEIQYKIRKVTEKHSSTLRMLAQRCKPLDIHTPYTYWVVCRFFGNGCFIIEKEDEPIAYIMTVENENEIFIWQIGVIENYRCQGLSQTLIEQVFSYAKKRKKKKILVTIDPKNLNSRGAFSKYCFQHEYKMSKVDEVHLTDFMITDFKEDEDMYIIIID